MKASETVFPTLPVIGFVVPVIVRKPRLNAIKAIGVTLVVCFAIHLDGFHDGIPFERGGKKKPGNYLELL
jgi:hypothetical protein